MMRSRAVTEAGSFVAPPSRVEIRAEETHASPSWTGPGRRQKELLQMILMPLGTHSYFVEPPQRSGHRAHTHAEPLVACTCYSCSTSDSSSVLPSNEHLSKCTVLVQACHQWPPVLHLQQSPLRPLKPQFTSWHSWGYHSSSTASIRLIKDLGGLVGIDHDASSQRHTVDCEVLVPPFGQRSHS